MPANTPTTSQLKRALEISERIEQLQRELDAVLGGSPAPAAAPKAAPAPAAAAKRGRPPGKLSPEARERIAAAQRLRWAKAKGLPLPEASASAPAKKAAGKARSKRVISPEARAKMAEAARRRWAAQKKK